MFSYNLNLSLMRLILIFFNNTILHVSSYSRDHFDYGNLICLIQHYHLQTIPLQISYAINHTQSYQEVTFNAKPLFYYNLEDSGLQSHSMTR